MTFSLVRRNLATEMKLAFSTNAFTRFSLFDAINAIKEAGYAGVEILADVPHAYPEQIDAKLTGDVVKALQSERASPSPTSTATAPSATGKTRRPSPTSSRA